MWAPDGWRAQFKDIREWMKTTKEVQHDGTH